MTSQTQRLPIIALRRKTTRHAWLTYAALYGGIGVFLIIFLFPVYWMVSASIQPNSEILKTTPNLVPMQTTLDSYANIFTQPEFTRYFSNSVFVSTATIVLSLFVGILAGYAFSRYQFFGKNLLFTSVLSIQMFPRVALLIPLFILFRNYGLNNTPYSLVLANLTTVLPFTIWFLKAFFDSVPFELEEAAFIDGATRLQTLWLIVVPLSIPGILSVATYGFVITWNDFVYAFTLVSDDAQRTLPVGLSLQFIGQYTNDWSGMMALSVLASLPLLALFIFSQRFMLGGLTAGALKD